MRTTLGLVAELAGAHIGTSNQAPVANPQSVTTAEDTAKAITLTGSDPDGNPLTYSVVTQPGHGSLSGTAPHLTYTPAANYNGADSFTFKVNDGTVDSAPATVSITVTPVNDAPVANAQAAATNEDTAKAITLTGSDVDGNPLTYSVVTQPGHGSLSGHRAQPDLHPGRQLQRRGQLHLQGQRWHGRFGAGHGQHHGHAGQRRAGGERAGGDDQRGHGEGHHPDAARTWTATR